MFNIAWTLKRLWANIHNNYDTWAYGSQKMYSSSFQFTIFISLYTQSAEEKTWRLIKVRKTCVFAGASSALARYQIFHLEQRVSLIQGIDSQTFVQRLFLALLDAGMESIANHLHFTGLEGLNKISDLDSLTFNYWLSSKQSHSGNL
jgi:hypothetical protein